MVLQDDLSVWNGSYEELAALFFGSCLVLGGEVSQHLHCFGSLYKPWPHT